MNQKLKEVLLKIKYTFVERPAEETVDTILADLTKTVQKLELREAALVQRQQLEAQFIAAAQARQEAAAAEQTRVKRVAAKLDGLLK